MLKAMLFSFILGVLLSRDIQQFVADPAQMLPPGLQAIAESGAFAKISAVLHS